MSDPSSATSSGPTGSAKGPSLRPTEQSTTNASNYSGASSSGRSTSTAAAAHGNGNTSINHQPGDSEQTRQEKVQAWWRSVSLPSSYSNPNKKMKYEGNWRAQWDRQAGQIIGKVQGPNNNNRGGSDHRGEVQGHNNNNHGGSDHRGGRGSTRGGRGGRGRGWGRGAPRERGGGARRGPALSELMKELSNPMEQVEDRDHEADLESHFSKLELAKIDHEDSDDESFEDAPEIPTNSQSKDENGDITAEPPGSSEPSTTSQPSELQKKLRQYKSQMAAASSPSIKWVVSRAVPKKSSASRGFVRGTVSPELEEKVKNLPIAAKKEELLKLVKDHQVVLLRGDTGSGKSTQVPVFLADAGYGENGRICVTQPRRIAATSLARRVSEETGTPLGSLVGHVVRFSKFVKSTTIIKYVTDGILLKELIKDPTLSKYSVIIVDEAHERSDNTDVCLALLNRLVKKKIREDLKVIVSSATLNLKKFQDYFIGAPVLEVNVNSQTRNTIVYDKSDRDYMQGAVDQVLKLLGLSDEATKKYPTKANGDILVFLCGEDEIFQTKARLSVEIDRCKAENRLATKVHILPCFGGMTLEDQEEIFKAAPPGEIKVVLATNIAETSITIDGIMYVIDCGFQKEDNYDHKSGIGYLTIKRISQDQAIQRAGRAGRTGTGIVYRLYTEKTYEEMAKNATPEIQRSNIDGIVLDLVAMKLDLFDKEELEFIDEPIGDKVCDALVHLQELKALNSKAGLTAVGEAMSRLPVDPPLAKALMKSLLLECVEEVLVLVSILSTKHINLFKKSREGHELKEKYADESGDLLSYLNLWRDWKAEDFNKDWNKQFLNISILLEALDIQRQLKTILVEVFHFPKPLSSCGTDISRIGKALSSGLFRRVAVRSPKHPAAYVTCGGSGEERNEVFIHASSFLSKAFFRENDTLPALLLYDQVFKTKKTCISGLHVVEAQWLLKYAGNDVIQRIMDLLQCCIVDNPQ